MTQKDLLYLEDAVKHQDNLISLWNFYTEIILDEDLVDFINAQVSKLSTVREKLVNVMKEVKDER